MKENITMFIWNKIEDDDQCIQLHSALVFIEAYFVLRFPRKILFVWFLTTCTFFCKMISVSSCRKSFSNSGSFWFEIYGHIQYDHLLMWAILHNFWQVSLLPNSLLFHRIFLFFFKNFFCKPCNFFCHSILPKRFINWILVELEWKLDFVNLHDTYPYSPCSSSGNVK